MINGYWFYEKQADKLGNYFLDSLFSDIDLLSIYAGIHPKFFGNYFRMLSKRFPFAIYYRIDAKTALVYAVLDCRKDPAWIRSKFE